MKSTNLFCLIIKFFFSPLLIQVNEKTSASEKQNPLAWVSVQFKRTTIGVLKDKDGKFHRHIPVDVRILSFSFTGLKTREIKTGAQSGFTIVIQVEGEGSIVEQ